MFRRKLILFPFFFKIKRDKKEVGRAHYACSSATRKKRWRKNYQVPHSPGCITLIDERWEHLGARSDESATFNVDYIRWMKGKSTSSALHFRHLLLLTTENIRTWSRCPHCTLSVKWATEGKELSIKLPLYSIFLAPILCTVLQECGWW